MHFLDNLEAREKKEGYYVLKIKQKQFESDCEYYNKKKIELEKEEAKSKKKLSLEKQFMLERCKYYIAIGYDINNPKPPLHLLVNLEKRATDIANLTKKLMKLPHEELAEKLSQAMFFEADANIYIDRTQTQLKYFKDLLDENKRYRFKMSNEKQNKPKKEVYINLRNKAEKIIKQMSEPYSKKLFHKAFKEMLTEENLKNIATQKTISQWFDDITKEIKYKKAKDGIMSRLRERWKNRSTSRDS
jgi:uncharacterized protein with von Willebrand factor type A (vWA) domain